MMNNNYCVIDLIISRKLPAAIIYESNEFIAFLDHSPLFIGHTLLAPKIHYPTIYDLPPNLATPFVSLIQKLGKAIGTAMKSQGSFIAINNIVSQSIPHLHVHLVPRNKGDGLKGFFWPRTKYKDENEMRMVQGKIIREMGE